MKNVYISIKFTAIIMLGSLFSIRPAVAQNGYILSGFRDVSQSSYLNPAFVSGAKTVVGIPVLANFSTGLISSGGGLANYLATNAGSGSVTFDVSNLVNSGLSTDKVTEYTDIDLVYAGFKAGSTFISLGARQHTYIRSILDRDVLRLLSEDSTELENQTLNLSNTSAKALQVIDYHIGISIPVAKNFHVGARFHLLQGLADISTENNGIIIKTERKSNDDFEIHALTRFAVNTSGLPDSNDFQLNKYVTNFGNLGFSVDLGVDVQVARRFWINASFINWGKIYFKSNTKTYYPASDSVNFSSKNMNINGNGSGGSLSDTLQNIFDIKDEARNYDVKLPSRLIIGAEYYTKDYRNDFSFLFSGRFFEDSFEPAFSVGYTRFVSPHFSVKAGYTWIKEAPMNFGLAMALNLHPFQLYLYSENITALFQWDQQKYVQAGFGLNIRIAPRNTRKNPNNPKAIRNLRPDIIMK